MTTSHTTIADELHTGLDGLVRGAKRRSRFHITFETVTPESAEQGDAASRGYVHPNGGRDDLDLVGDVADYAFDLRGAVRFVGENATFDCGRWFDTTWHDDDFRTGAETRYSLHPPRDITASSYARLVRVLGARS